MPLRRWGALLLVALSFLAGTVQGMEKKKKVHKPAPEMIPQVIYMVSEELDARIKRIVVSQKDFPVPYGAKMLKTPTFFTETGGATFENAAFQNLKPLKVLMYAGSAFHTTKLKKIGGVKDGIMTLSEYTKLKPNQTDGDLRCVPYVTDGSKFDFLSVEEASAYVDECNYLANNRKTKQGDGDNFPKEIQNAKTASKNLFTLYGKIDSVVGVREFPNFRTKKLQKMHWSAGNVWDLVGKYANGSKFVVNDNGGSQTQFVTECGLFQDSAYQYNNDEKGLKAKASNFTSKQAWNDFFTKTNEGKELIAKYKQFRDGNVKIIQLATGEFRKDRNAEGQFSAEDTHKYYWEALQEVLPKASEFIIRPKLDGCDVEGILPQYLEQGTNVLMAEQCAEYISQYAIMKRQQDFENGKPIYCAVKMCDMGSSSTQEQTVLYTITKRGVTFDQNEEKMGDSETERFTLECRISSKGNDEENSNTSAWEIKQDGCIKFTIAKEDKTRQVTRGRRGKIDIKTHYTHITESFEKVAFRGTYGMNTDKSQVFVNFDFGRYKYYIKVTNDLKRFLRCARKHLNLACQGDGDNSYKTAKYQERSDAITNVLQGLGEASPAPTPRPTLGRIPTGTRSNNVPMPASPPSPAAMNDTLSKFSKRISNTPSNVSKREDEKDAVLAKQDEEGWSVGSIVEVFAPSTSGKKKWFTGRVTAVGKQNILTVTYNRDGKLITPKGPEGDSTINISRTAGRKIIRPKTRRRMAQREFSDKRDSPVMVRLLKEIFEANQRANDRD